MRHEQDTLRLARATLADIIRAADADIIRACDTLIEGGTPTEAQDAQALKDWLTPDAPPAPGAPAAPAANLSATARPGGTP